MQKEEKKRASLFEINRPQGNQLIEILKPKLSSFYRVSAYFLF